MPDETPKIIIDEGWKAQVQREREEAARKRELEAQQAQQAAPAAEVAAADTAPAAQEMPLDGEEEALEEASFLNLVATLATQAMFALGVMAPQGTRQVMVNLDQAKYLLDTLEMLQVKTAGNRTEEESGALEEAVAELQRIYLARVQQWQEETLRQSGINPADLKGNTTPFPGMG